MARARFKLHLHDLVRENGIHYEVSLEQALLAYQWLCSTVKPTDRAYGRWGDYTPWNLIDAKSSVGGERPAPITSLKDLERRFRHVFLSRDFYPMYGHWRKREGIRLDATRWIQGPILDQSEALSVLITGRYGNEERKKLEKRPLLAHLNPCWVDAVEYRGLQVQLHPGKDGQAYWSVILEYGFNGSAWEELLTRSRPREAPETWARRAVQWWHWFTERRDAVFVDNAYPGFVVMRDRQACMFGLPLRRQDMTEEQRESEHGRIGHHRGCRHEQIAGPFETWAEAEDHAIRLNNKALKPQ